MYLPKSVISTKFTPSFDKNCLLLNTHSVWKLLKNIYWFCLSKKNIEMSKGFQVIMVWVAVPIHFDKCTLKYGHLTMTIVLVDPLMYHLNSSKFKLLKKKVYKRKRLLIKLFLKIIKYYFVILKIWTIFFFRWYTTWINYTVSNFS